MNRVSTDQTERVGVEAVRFLFADLGWFAKEAVRPDYGVDLFVETSDNRGRPTGRLLAIQVKSGQSYIGAADVESPLYVSQAHIDYWMGYSIPVLVVLYDPNAHRAYWQVVTAETAESTRTGWKITVPHAQALTPEALEPLAHLAAPPKLQPPLMPEPEARLQPELEPVLSRLNTLRADLTWMEVLERGGEVTLEAQEWINKTSGRVDLRLIAEPANGSDPIERHFVVFLGGLRPYAEALPELFPWATVYADEGALEAHDEEEWMEETGIWDSDDKCYVGNTETFADWHAGRYSAGALRPHAESMGEVAHWRLSLALNDVGRGVLALERLLSGT